MKQILEGVAFLHNKNIAHLDLKPQNLLLSVKDSCDDIKLCDFGISKVLRPGVIVREILGKKFRLHDFMIEPFYFILSV